MSENKYIIDKDSLTGIADAVRDKLGTGEATTDSQTGDIIYPEDKGYYLKDTTLAKISGFGWSQTGYRGSFDRNYAPRIESADWDEAVGEPWYSVEITLNNVSGDDSYDMSVQYSGGRQEFTTVRSSTYTVSVPNGSTYFNLDFSNTYSSSIYYGSSSLGSLTAIFKDAEGKPIRPKQSSYQYHQGNVVRTANFQSALVPTPIPMSLTDINNNISTYLTSNTGGGGTLETWHYLCTNKTYVSLPSDFSIENLKDVFFLTSTSLWDACGLYKNSVGKPVSLKDQGIALPSSYSGMNSPVTQAKIATAYNEGRIFSIPWISKDFGNNKIIPDKTSFCWILVEPADSKIYVGAGRYINYTGIGYWTVVYTK